MKKVIKILLTLLIVLTMKNVYAKNYTIKELIPRNVRTTIKTNNFNYKNMYFDNQGVHFNGIKNITDRKLPISISIGLFDEKGKNIGTINYCENGYMLNSDNEMGFIIEFSKNYLANEKDVGDIEYISVLSDNIYCKTGGTKEYIGEDVDELGISHTNKFDNNKELFLSIITILGGALTIIIIYKLLFSRAYKNIDGGSTIEIYKAVNIKSKDKNKNGKDNIEKNTEELKQPLNENILEKKSDDNTINEIEILEFEEEQDDDYNSNQ